MDSISTSQVGVEDRISQSPDDILVHILSFLPTLYSVRTMVLSKRWNNLWTSVPNLDFDQQDIRQGNFDSFATFVEGALLLYNSSSTIRKFRLHFLRNIFLQDKRIARIRNWICTVMSSHEVGEVDISLVPYLGKDLELKLPRRLFMCKTLEVLRVESNCITYPSTKPGYFPSLKLADVKAEDGDHSSMGQIFCNCPVLEELRIYANMYRNDVEVHISAPELRTLRTSFFVDNYRMLRGISINAPKLENLVVYGSTLTKYIFKNAESLVKANIYLEYFDTDSSRDCLHRATALLAGVSGVEYLCISGPNYVASSLPTFSNLKQLKLLLLGSSYWKYVMELLNRSPKLEDLVLDIDVHSWYDEHYVQGYEPFTPPEIVPICVLSHLKTISITNITGHDDQLDVVKYLLKYGQVLKNVCIFTTGHLLFKTRHITEKKFQKKVLKYQKSSKTCEVEVKFENKGVGSWTCYDCGRSTLYIEDELFFSQKKIIFGS